MQAVVHAADMQDPSGDSEAASLRESLDGGVLLVASLFGLYPFLLKLYADGRCAGPQFWDGLAQVTRPVNIEIVRRSDAGRFVVLPKRWIVERTIAWLDRCRCLAKDWERLNHNALAFLQWASVRLMVRKLCQINK